MVVPQNKAWLFWRGCVVCVSEHREWTAVVLVYGASLPLCLPRHEVCCGDPVFSTQTYVAVYVFPRFFPRQVF